MAFPGPTPPYNNPPIAPQFYMPSRFVIENVALGPTTTVTTTEDHNYVVGQFVRLIIPPSFGCYQLNEQAGYVLSVPSSTEVELEINSSMNVDAYVASYAATQAQILAVGAIGNGQTNANGRSSNLTYIPGSFQNISP